MLDERLGITPREGVMGEGDLLTAADVQASEAQRLADQMFLDESTGEYRYYDPDVQAWVPLSQEEALARAAQPLPTMQVEYDEGAPLYDERPGLPEVQELGTPTDVEVTDTALPLPEVTEQTVEDITLEGVRTPPARTRAPVVPPEQLQAFVDQQMSSGRRMTQRDLLTAEDMALESLFTVGQDDAGNPTYSRYNADLQRMEVVPPNEARREARAEVRRMQQPPSVGWKQRLTRELGVPPQSMRGAPWERFIAAVEQAGVRPDDANAGEFLAQIAPTLPRGDTETNRFAVRMAEQFAAPTDAEINQTTAVATAEAGAAQVDGDVTPQAEAAAKEQVDAVEAPAAEQVVDTFVPGQVVPNVVPAGEPVRRNTQAQQTLVTRANQFVRSGDAETQEDGVALAVSDGMYDDSIRTATDLDGYFTGVKNTDAYQALPDDVQTRLTQEFSELFDQMESVGRFKRLEGTRGDRSTIGQAEFDTLVAQANDKLPNNLRVVGYRDAADYRNTTGRPAPDDVQGVYTDGTIHLIRSNIANKGEFATTLMHEQGHDGLRGLLGDRLPAVINRLYANAALRPRIEQARQRLEVDRITAGEEVLADMIAHGETLTGDVRSKIRNAIAQGAATILGVGDLRVSDTRVDELLTHTAAYIRGRHIHKGTSLADELRNVTLDKVTGDPGALKESALYSRNLAALERALLSVDSDTSRVPVTADDALGTATEHSRKALGAVASRAREGVQALFRGTLHATPLYWLNRTYARMWQTETGNAMNDYADSVMNREAEGNRLINEKHTLRYDVPTETGGTREVTMQASPHDIALRWTRLHNNHRAQYDALNVVDRYSTLYRVWPDRNWDQQPQVDYQQEGFTEQERRQALSRIQDAWRRAGPEGQEIFRLTQGDYRRQWGARFHALAEEYSRTTGIPRTLEDGTPNPEFQSRIGTLIDNALNRMRSGPYAPLTRYGNYYAVGYDADGNRVHASAYDTRAEAERAAAALRNERTSDGQAMTVGVSAAAQYLPTLDGINHGALRTFEQGVENSLPADIDPGLKNGLLQGIREAYLQSVPGHSLMVHANQRRGIEGFNMDALRAYSDYTMKNMRSILTFNHDGNISRSLTSMEDHVRELTRSGSNTVTHRQVLDAVRTQRDRYLKAESNPATDFLGQAGFMQYLATPSQLFVNGMQTAFVAFPRLAGAFGGGKALGSIRRAMQTFLMSGGDLMNERSTIDPDVRRALESLRVDGTLAFTQTHDMLDLAGGDLQAMSGHWHTIKKVAGAFVHKSEVFNRQVTAAAAAELALPGIRREFGIAEGQRLTDEAVQALAHTAKQHTLDSNFIFSSSDKPGLLQGPYRKLLFQFQHYRFNMLAMMGRDIRDSFQGTPAEKQTARRTLAYLLGTQAALTGVTGTILAPVAFAIMDLFRDDDDLLDSRTEFLMHAPQILSHGVLSGLLDMSRLDSGSLLPGLGDRAYAPTNATGREQVQYYAMRNLGPWLGLGADYAELASKMAEGKLVEAMQVGLPKFFRDPIAAVTGMSGVKDARDVVYFEPGIGTTVAQAVGLRSGSRRQAEDLRSARYKVAQNVSTLRGRYMGMAALGLSTDDDALVQEAYDKIRAWNDRYPDLAITPSDVRRSITGRYRAQMLADLYGTTTAGHISPSELEALNL